MKATWNTVLSVVWTKTKFQALMCYLEWSSCKWKLKTIEIKDTQRQSMLNLVINLSNILTRRKQDLNLSVQFLHCFITVNVECHCHHVLWQKRKWYIHLLKKLFFQLVRIGASIFWWENMLKNITQYLLMIM
jgi:hypothetical protein